jgi:hypothetical protein
MAVPIKGKIIRRANHGLRVNLDDGGQYENSPHDVTPIRPAVIATSSIGRPLTHQSRRAKESILAISGKALQYYCNIPQSDDTAENTPGHSLPSCYPTVCGIVCVYPLSPHTPTHSSCKVHIQHSTHPAPFHRPTSTPENNQLSKRGGDTPVCTPQLGQRLRHYQDKQRLHHNHIEAFLQCVKRKG